MSGRGPKWLSATNGGLRLAVQIAPNAKRTEVIAATEDTLRIRLQAPPVDGKANEALIRFIADTLRVPKSAVEITHGFTARRKLLEVRAADLTVEAAAKALAPGA